MTLVIRVFVFIVLISIAEIGACAADETKLPQTTSTQTDATKSPSFKSVLKRCASRQKELEAYVDDLTASLDKASKSDDLSQVKQAIEETRKKLSELKVSNSKSSALIQKAEKHLDKITRKKNAKASEMIDSPDSDFDEVIWAF